MRDEEIVVDRNAEWRLQQARAARCSRGIADDLPPRWTRFVGGRALKVKSIWYSG